MTEKAESNPNTQEEAETGSKPTSVDEASTVFSPIVTFSSLDHSETNRQSAI
jgi:hypothetical protein